MTVIKMTTLADLKEQEDAASITVEAASEKREDAIEAVLKDEWMQAIDAWSIPYDKRMAAERRGEASPAATKH